uniref:Uncharacterized protein n=1 Tax=Hyaloperonospora arabidopsidis (strain Emoy2) TaxID=559515 RepID=M4BSN7_HYAAE
MALLSYFTTALQPSSILHPSNTTRYDTIPMQPHADSPIIHSPSVYNELESKQAQMPALDFLQLATCTPRYKHTSSPSPLVLRMVMDMISACNGIRTANGDRVDVGSCTSNHFHPERRVRQPLPSTKTATQSTSRLSSQDARRTCACPSPARSR